MEQARLDLTLPVIPLARLAELWGIAPRQLGDALRAHGVPVVRARHTTVALVRLADLTALFAASRAPGESAVGTAMRVVASEPTSADDVLRNLGLRRRTA